MEGSIIPVIILPLKISNFAASNSFALIFVISLENDSEPMPKYPPMANTIRLRKYKNINFGGYKYGYISSPPD